MRMLIGMVNLPANYSDVDDGEAEPVGRSNGNSTESENKIE
jgi:hypothetical protein